MRLTTFHINFIMYTCSMQSGSKLHIIYISPSNSKSIHNPNEIMHILRTYMWNRTEQKKYVLPGELS